MALGGRARRRSGPRRQDHAAYAATKVRAHEPGYATGPGREPLLGGWAGQLQAIELLTGDGYLLALAQDEAARKSADDYLAGTLDGLIVINEVTRIGRGPDVLPQQRAGRASWTMRSCVGSSPTGCGMRHRPRCRIRIRTGCRWPSWAGPFLNGKFPCAEAARQRHRRRCSFTPARIDADNSRRACRPTGPSQP